MARATKPRKTLAEQKSEAEAALAKLHAEVGALTTGEDWTKYLAFSAGFRGYSPLNIMLMLSQWQGRCKADPSRPQLSLPAAHSVWSGKGGWVRKGEKGLGVLVPIRVRDREADAREDGSQPQKLVGWRLVFRTFDVSQIEGIEVPENPAKPKVLEGEGDADLWTALVRVAEDIGYSVEVTDEVLPANGDCNFAAKRLRVAASRTGAQQLKTLAHEIAHAFMHSPAQYLLAHDGSTNVIEVEAESVAFTVMSMLGRDTADYSVGYVASWAKGDSKLIAKTAERVIATAQRIVTALEGEQPDADEIDTETEEVAAA